MGSNSPPEVSPRIFQAVQRVNVSLCTDCDDVELRPVLASLVRMSLIASLDRSDRCLKDRTLVLEVLSRIELVNNLVALLSIDFHALETDVKKEQQLRAKVGSSTSDSVLIGNLSLGPALEFERSDATRRLRLVLSELVAILGHVHQQLEVENSSKIVLKPSELFDHLVYFSEVCDVLCIALAELPMLLHPPEVCEALLRLKFGPWIICHVVVNQPDSFNDVVLHLIRNGDKQDEEGNGNKIRQHAIALLCKMNPDEIAHVRSKCIELCRLPSLTLQLTIELHKTSGPESDDLVAFMSGLLLGSDPQIRSWISFFVRSVQKRRNENLQEYRKHLVLQLQSLTQSLMTTSSKWQRHDTVVKATAILRLFTALRGIAGMKFTEEEIICIFDLITCKPPATPAGIKFVSLGLSTLIACPSIIAADPGLEKRAVEWIRWLVKEESYFEEQSGVSASFGEMLLLMAIHFHSQQLSAICELVCQTLGMKIAIRTSSMGKIKSIFTQEIFTEQFVAHHAIKVPVTKQLSSNVTGFLPIHCIHQLLKSRTFSKHRAPIKDWIFRQIKEASVPLHPVLPQLIEAFVSSILVPATNSRSISSGQPLIKASVLTSTNQHTDNRMMGQAEQTNEPLDESDIKEVFSGLLGNSRAPKVSLSHITPQITMLYYVLLYENVRLLHMRSIVLSQRKVKIYSKDLLSDLPVKLLVKAAEREQEKLGSLFPQLLKLCSSQFPHLCFVQDWLMVPNNSTLIMSSRLRVTEAECKEALEAMTTCPAKLTLVILKLLQWSPMDAWAFVDLFVGAIHKVLHSNVPRKVRELYVKLWFMLNEVLPRKLWAKTVNALLQSQKRQTQDDLILDPLQVLRCDKSVFECPVMLNIVLYILKACLAASRTQLMQHICENPIVDRNTMSQLSNETEREDLKNALVQAQESASIQILLEACVPNGNSGDKIYVQQKEVQSRICSYIHEAFIADPTMAKLVHFQGYPHQVLPVTATGVPSIHICLDFTPELLSQPDLEKQAFAVDLISHLSIQYALPKSFSVARLAVNSLSTLLSVLSMEERGELFPTILPSLVRICTAFPPLTEDVIRLLMQYGKVCVSETCLSKVSSVSKRGQIDRIRTTFSLIVSKAMMEKNSF